MPPGTRGQSCPGLIKVIPGLDRVEEIEVLLHELAHDILHPHTLAGLNRVDVQPGKEVQAEAVSLMVRLRLGMDAGPRSAPYIHHHNFPVQGVEVDLLTASLDRIGLVSDNIMANFNE